MKKIIAIDGPAGSGKSTLARRVAKELGFFLLDTGALYRVTALHLLNRGVSITNPKVSSADLDSLDMRIDPVPGSMLLFLNGDDVTDVIRREYIGTAASILSALPDVRAALLDIQRSAGENWDLVAEGRDMGTVVFPHASVKFFLTASLEERSRRRYLELVNRGLSPSLEEVIDDMRARDERDEKRSASPLKPAADAIIMDTSGSGIDEVVREVLLQVRRSVSRV